MDFQMSDEFFEFFGRWWEAQYHYTDQYVFFFLENIQIQLNSKSSFQKKNHQQFLEGKDLISHSE